jgi:hypothetical protein
VSRPADLCGEVDVSAAATVVVDGVRVSVGFLRDLTLSPPVAVAPWKLLRISCEVGSDDVQVTEERAVGGLRRGADHAMITGMSESDEVDLVVPMDGKLVRVGSKALKTLTPREEIVLKMRFGTVRPLHTYEEIGRTFSVPKERIRQIELKALRKLRHPSRATELSVWLVGRETSPLPWEVGGVYATREEAVARCRQRVDFVMELRLGEDAPEKRTDLPAGRCWYPLADLAASMDERGVEIR